MSKKKLVDEFAPYNLDKPPSFESKSIEQLRRHSIDKSLENRPIERALHILMVGDDIQKLSVLHSLPTLLVEDVKGCLQKIIPKMNQGLIQGSTEYQITACSAVRTVIDQRILPADQIVHNFLFSVLKCVESRDENVSKAWFETLLEIVSILPIATINREIMPTAIAKTDLSKPVAQRIMSCKLLGRIAKNCNAFILKKDVFPLVQTLAQDSNKDVRASICAELPVCASIMTNSIDKDIMPLLNEFANDDDRVVKMAAFQALVDIIPFLTPELLRLIAIPLTKKLMEQFTNTVEDDLKVVVSRNIGKICIGFEKVISHIDRQWLLESYSKLAHLGLPNMRFQGRSPMPKQLLTLGRSMQDSDPVLDCRINCAYNIPAILKFAQADPTSVTSIVYPIISDLTVDPCFKVRRTVAASIHEVANLLKQDNNLITSDFIKLLKDDVDDVLQNIVPNMKATLERFSETKTLTPEFVDETAIELAKALQKCEAEISSTYKWRLHSKFIEQLEVLPKCLPSDLIYQHIVPILNRCLFVCRHVPCRLATVKSLMVILRYNLKPQQRNEIRSRILNDLASSPKFYNRIIFARSCEQIMHIFSANYYREYFFAKTIQLVEDKVANIRLIGYGLLPQLKIIAKAVEKTAPKLLQMVDNVIKNAKFEKDRDCIACIQNVNIKLERLQQTMFKIDPSDNKKFEEEKVINASPPGKEWKPTSSMQAPASGGRQAPTMAGVDKSRIPSMSAVADKVGQPSRYGGVSTLPVRSMSAPVSSGVTRVDSLRTAIGPTVTPSIGRPMFQEISVRAPTITSSNPVMSSGTYRSPPPSPSIPAVSVFPSAEQKTLSVTPTTVSLGSPYLGNSETTVPPYEEIMNNLISLAVVDKSASIDDDCNTNIIKTVKVVNNDSNNNSINGNAEQQRFNNTELDILTTGQDTVTKPVEKCLKIPVRKFTSTKDIQKSLLRRYSSSCLDTAVINGLNGDAVISDNTNCDEIGKRKQGQRTLNKRPHSMNLLTSVTKTSSFTNDTNSISKNKNENSNNDNSSNINNILVKSSIVSRLPIRSPDLRTNYRTMRK